MIYRIFAVLAVIAVIVGSVLLTGQQREASAPTTVEEPMRDPGYAARNANLIQTGPDGHPLYTLSAALIRQLPGKGTVETSGFKEFYAKLQGKIGPDARKEARDDKQAADRQRHDNARNDNDKKAKDTDDRDRKRADDDKKSNDPHKDDWKNRKHDDKWDKDWDHNRDRNHHRHDWDTHRHYYRYGYYGPGWYDDCGYYSSGYDGYDDNYNYYGPDACGYEYGAYRSHFLVDMSGDQVVPNPGPPDAVGTGNLDIDVPNGVVCFRLAYDGIDRAVGAQIHPGRLGEGGPSLVLLHVGENGDDGCVGADPRILSEIQNDPRGYYLEVDDQNGPAMRGQLDAPDYRNRY